MTRFTPQWLQAGSYAASVDRRLIGALWPAPACFGCAVSAGAGMTVSVAAGQVAVPTQNGTGTTLCSSDAAETVTVAAAPPAGQDRIDVIICRPRGTDLDGGADNDFIFDVVAGTPAASPAVPATPPGTVALGRVRVTGGSATVSAGNLTDVRPSPLAVGSLPSSTPRGYAASGRGPATTVDAAGTLTIVYTLAAVPLTANRRYLIHATAFASLVSAASSSGSMRVYDPSGVDNVFLGNIVGTMNVNQILSGAASMPYIPVSSGNANFTIRALTSAGALRFVANSCYITVEDIGGA